MNVMLGGDLPSILRRGIISKFGVSFFLLGPGSFSGSSRFWKLKSETLKLLEITEICLSVSSSFVNST